MEMDVNKIIKETAEERQRDFEELYAHIDALELNLFRFKKYIAQACNAEPNTYIAAGMLAHDVRGYACQMQKIAEIVGRIENKNFAIELLTDMQEGDE